MQATSDDPIFSFAIVADTHLTEDESLSFESSDATGNRLADLYNDLVARVNAMNPAFVVHLGDITDPVPVSSHYVDSAEAFHAASQAFSMPYHLVPGNHDIGEKIHPALPGIDDNVSITKRAIDQYEQHFGRQRYSFEHDGCLFLVINTMLINSGLSGEQEQWDWLEQTLSDNQGKRVFIFAHYPLFLSDRNEPDFYDNIDEPGRSKLIDVLKPHQVEGYYAGHVHNYFYTHLNGMHQFVLPSTGIIRSDYMEFFRSTPTRDTGAFDPSKIGFFWVDVYTDLHVPSFIRSNNDHSHRTHSWNNSGSTVSVDLRIPWCDKVDIPTPWGLEIFERKYVRNDYPLAALWEMGVRDLRVPISDLLEPVVSERVKLLSQLGHRFTVVMFGLPNEERRAALADHAGGIRAVEVVGLFNQWQPFAAPLRNLRESSDFEVYLHAVRPEVEGWNTHHGMHVDLGDEIAWVLSEADLKDAVDGFVFGVRRDMAPFDGYLAAQACLSGTSHKALLHVPSVGMYWSMASNDDVAEKEELARVAEAVMMARALPDLSVVIDNFVELDRGYCSCWGLVDRFYNPKDGSRTVRALHALLPQRLGNLTCQNTSAGRVLSATSDQGKAALLCGSGVAGSGDVSDILAGDVADTQGRLIDLVTGHEIRSDFGTALAERTVGDTPKGPALFLL